jgi:hypothetical protein
MVGIGVVVRDSRDEATSSMPKAHITALGIMEAIVALWAVRFCQEFGFSRVVLEGDVFRSNAGERGSNWSRYGHIIGETRGVLNVELSS